MRGLRPAGAAALAAVAAIGLAGCFGGGDDEGSAPPPLERAAPLATELAQPVAAIEPGQAFRPAASTPKAVTRAVQRHQVVVVAFTMPGVADDDHVAAALRAVRASGPRGVAYFTYTLGQSRRFGDLPDLLGVTVSPTVAVIGRDGVLLNKWEGLVDEEILRQSIADAKRTAPAPGASPDAEVSTGAPSRATGAQPGASGNRAAIALARKVDQVYANAPGVKARMRVSANGETSTGTLLMSLRNGQVIGMVADAEIPGQGEVTLLFTPAGGYARINGSCWVAGGQPPVATDIKASTSGRFGPPRRDGDVVVLRATGGANGPTVLRVDARTNEIVSITQRDGATVMSDFEILDEAPTLPEPEPLC